MENKSTELSFTSIIITHLVYICIIIILYYTVASLGNVLTGASDLYFRRTTNSNKLSSSSNRVIRYRSM